MSEVAEATEALKLAFGKIEELTRQYGPQAVDTAAEVTRVNAIGHFMWAGAFGVIFLGCTARRRWALQRLGMGRPQQPQARPCPRPPGQDRRRPMSAADPFTKASDRYLEARRLGCDPLPLAFGEVAETGRLPFLSGRDIAALAVLIAVGWVVLTIIERLAS